MRTDHPATTTYEHLAEARTHLVAERTLFTVLRTDLSIAGGGCSGHHAVQRQTAQLGAGALWLRLWTVG